MKNFFKIFLIAFAIFIFAGNLNAQVNLKMKRPPINQLKASDLWSATIINNGEAFTAYLYGSMMNNDNGEMIATGQTMTFDVKKGMTNFKISDLPKIPDVNYTAKDPKYKQSFMNTGGAPPGDYKICIELRTQGNEVKAEDCIDQKITGGDAPQLISPRNEEELKIDNPVFSWMHIKPPTSNLTYSLKIVELKGDESPENAILKNKAFFEKEGIVQQLFQYPASAEKFVAGKKYAWQVSIGDLKSEVSIFDRWGNLLVVKPVEEMHCNDFKISFSENSSPIPTDRNEKTRPVSNEKQGCGFDISVINNYKGPPEFNPERLKISVSDGSIVSAISNIKGIARTPDKIPPQTNSIDWKNTTGYLPSGQINLGTIYFANSSADSFYVVYEFIGKEGRTICRDSLVLYTCTDDKCKNDLIRNGGFFQGSIQGTMPSPGASQYWTSGYGTPNLYFDMNDQNEGFMEHGHVKLTGNLTNGQSVAQAFDANNKIIAGKYYKVSVAVRFNSSGNNIDYGKIRAIAFNGSITNGPGIHPPPSTNVGLIGRSGKIKDCGVWSVIEFPVWKANKDFLNIAINVFTNDNQTANVEIDDISMCESSKEDCQELQVDNAGNPIIPSSIGDPTAGYTCQPVADNDDFYTGSLQDLYPQYNGTTDFYSQAGNDPCFSVGGKLPDEVINYNCDESLKAAGIDMSCSQIQGILNTPYTPPETKMTVLPPIPPLTNNNNCDTIKNSKFNNMPFKGRDIIYIHGLQLGHLIDRVRLDPHASGNWPANHNEYYNAGYYKTVAYNNMGPHITHFLRNRGNQNRYLVVVYDCSENVETAINSVMSQIRDAMDNGTDVQADRNDPRGKMCFGKDYVFISHSTGALVSDLVLSIANKTKVPGPYQTKYGNVGYMSDRCKGRVSIQGAFTGSSLAKLACNMAQMTPALATVILGALSWEPLVIGSVNTLETADPSIINNSVLVDLIPEISMQRWGSLINDVPVPVITMGGGHPSAILGPLKYFMHPGFDDGVLTLDCEGGVNNPLQLGPSRFTATGYKVFDMGIPLQRAAKYYLDQTIGSSGSFASSMTPYLSPTGMVEPVQNIAVPQNYFNNHFPFVQGAKEHWFNTTELGSGNTPCDYGTTSIDQSVNNEEELVINNTNLYSSGIVDPSIASQMEETVRKLSIWIPWFKWKRWHGIRIPVPYMREFIIWKRTYHKLNDNCQYDVDYAYKYLFKQ
ncbi:hypothetical protein BH10BAC5_BH10BAC5_02990 [soil metagenome]